MMGIDRGYLALSITILGFGVAPIAIGIGYQDADPYSFLFLRFLFSLVLVSPIILRKNWVEIQELLQNKWVMLLCLSQGQAIVFQYLAQVYVDPSVATIINKSYLIFVPFLTPVFLKERFHLKHVSVAGIGIIGVYLVMRGDLQNVTFANATGIIFAVISSLGFALYIVFSSQLSKEMKVNNYALLWVVLAFMTLVSSFLMTVNSSNLSFNMTGSVVLSLVTLILASTVIAYFSYFYALKTIPPTTGSVLLLIQVIPSFISDYFFTNLREVDVNTPIFLLGSVIIIIASILAVHFRD